MAEQESLALFNDTPEELFMKGTMLSTIFLQCRKPLFCCTNIGQRNQCGLGRKRYYRNRFFPSASRARSIHFLRENAGTC